MIYAPVFDLSEAESSEIVLNCRSTREMDITPTFYTIDGKAYTGEDIHLHPAEIRFVDTKSLIPARERNRHKWGGISFSYVGGFMEAWAQLTLHGIHGGGSANVLFTVLSLARSNTSDAVWWAPRNGSAVIALGNSSNERIHASLMFSERETRVIDIAPFATEVVRLQSNSQTHSRSGHGEAITISYTGPSGALIPTGVTSSDDGKFVSMIRFYDTQNTVQQNLYAGGLRLGNATPRMVLRNTSADFITAKPKFLMPDGSPVNGFDTSTLRLAPQEVTEVDLTPLTRLAAHRPNLESVSVQVMNSGVAGSLIGALYGNDAKTGLNYDVPLRDSGGSRASTGGYPVRLDHDYTTIIHITNTTDTPGQFTMEIRYDGGRYVTGIIPVASGATKDLDIAKIRDRRILDVNGHTLPADLKTAQVIWSVRGLVRLNGRAEVVSIHDGVSSSYSCWLCCSNSFWKTAWVPEGDTINAGDYRLFTIWEYDANGLLCGGNMAPYPIAPSWWSEDTSIATVDYEGLVHGESAGETQLHAGFPVYYYQWNDFNESCDSSGDPYYEEDRTVAVRPKVTSISLDKGLIGTTVSVTISGQGFKSGATTVNAGTGITASVTSVSSTQINANLAINVDTSTGGNHSITVTSNWQTSSTSVNFYVQIPTSLSVSIGSLRTHTGGSITSCENKVAAPVAYGHSRLLVYTVLDQNGTAITQSGMTATEEVFKVSSNPANAGGDYFTSHESVMNGTFCDIQAFFTDASPPPVSGEYIKSKQYINITVPGRLDAVRVNCLDHEYNDVFITDTTSNPNATCQ